jgi:hypothetical protein
MSRIEPRVPEQSLGELFGHLSTDLSALLRDEVELAKIELKDEATRAARAGGLLGGAALAGFMVVVLLSFAAAWGLAEVVPIGWAFFLVGVVWAAFGTVLYLQGRDRLKTVSLKPQQTVETLKEDVQWAKTQKP